jgi:hypothetical protein
MIDKTREQMLQGSPVLHPNPQTNFETQKIRTHNNTTLDKSWISESSKQGTLGISIRRPSIGMLFLLVSSP